MRVRASDLFAAFGAAMAVSLTFAACSSSDSSNPTGPLLDGGAGGGRDGAGGGSGDAGADKCLPGDVTGFSGGDYHPPSGAHQGVCDSDAIEAYVDCQQNANAASCNYLTSSAAACLACIQTPTSADAWGPVVVEAGGTSAFINTPGCLALALGEGTSTTGCGGSLQKELNCELAACGTNCLNAPAEALASCESSSIGTGGGCAVFETAQAAACAGDGGGQGDMCYQMTGADGGPSEDTFAYAARLATYFCGFGAADAGATGDGG